jgi:hypothetical protein
LHVRNASKPNRRISPIPPRFRAEAKRPNFMSDTSGVRHRTWFEKIISQKNGFKPCPVSDMV